MAENVIIKGEKIDKKKLFGKLKKLFWGALAAYLILSVVIYAVSFSKYSKMQEQAINLMSISSADLPAETASRKEICEHFYDKLTRKYIPHPLGTYDNNSYVDATVDLFQAGIDGYSYSREPSRLFRFASFGEYAAGHFIDLTVLPTDCVINYIIVALLLVFAVLLFTTQGINKKNNLQEIIVTDEAVTGKSGKQSFSINIDRITGVSKGKMNSVLISSPGQNAKITMLKNQVEIVDVITDLVNRCKSAPVAAAEKSADISQLAELKKLLDAGIIDQTEFDAKKKEILGL